MKFSRRSVIRHAAASVAMLPLLATYTTTANAAPLEGFFEPTLLPEIFKGSKSAPVTLTEYASMTCPHCKTFHETVMPHLEERYIKTGKVRYALREFAFDPRASAAFMLARCSPEKNYYPMVDMLFERQSTWARSTTPVETLLKMAKLGGFNEARFNACLTDQDLLSKINAVKERGQNQFKVNAVPTLFIDGERIEHKLSLEKVSESIDAVLAEKS